MSYTLTIEASSIEELSGRLLALGSALATNGDPVMPELRSAAAPTRTRKKKTDADVGVEQAPLDAGTADEASASDAEASPPAAEPTAPEAPALDVVRDIQPLVLALNAAKGREAVIGVLQQFGVDRVTQLEPARLPELKTALENANK